MLRRWKPRAGSLSRRSPHFQVDLFLGEAGAEVYRRRSPLGLVPRMRRGAPANRKRPGTVGVPGRFVLSASYAAICLANGAVVLISILRGKAAAATGAVTSNTPFTYSAVSFSTFTPSGNARVLSNTP